MFHRGVRQLEAPSTTQGSCQGSEYSLYVVVSFLPFDHNCSPMVFFTLGRRSNPEGGDITHIFFLLRWRAYESERQLDDPTHPDYAAIHEPTEKEKASFERWLSYVNERFGGKAHIDASVFRFAAMKNLHPSVKVGPLSLFRMWGVFTNFDSGDDSITRPRHYSFAMFLLSPKVWYQQGRLQEAMSENSRAFETYEKLGVTDVSETPRALLQEIERAVNSRPAPENLDAAGEFLNLVLFPAFVDRCLLSA